MKITLFIFLMLTMLISMFACAAADNFQQGRASYYADKFQGKKTASGEIYDKKKLSAAHKTLPFGTRVRVTNLSNNKSVVVKINDRGPYTKNRIIDLSYDAARKIEMIKSGTVRVQVEILD